MNRPSILLLDELTGNLDKKNASEIINISKHLIKILSKLLF